MSLSLDEIYTQLTDLPGQIAQLEFEAETLKAKFEQAHELAELAETNAALEAVTDGKDAATRDLQRKRIVRQNANVTHAKLDEFATRAEWQGKVTLSENKRRMFSAFCKIAELQAAQYNLMAARTNGNGHTKEQ